MKEHSVQYKGRQCKGYIIANTDIRPFYYWFFFLDRDLVRLYGDSISFAADEGDELYATKIYCGDDEFVEAIKKEVQVFIEGAKQS